MASLEIPCPQCGMRLQLPDRSLLGRKGKCGKCGCRFILRDPAARQAADEVPLRLAGARAPEPSADDTLMGVAARWVPDDPGTARGANTQPNPASSFPRRPAPQHAAQPEFVGPADELAEDPDAEVDRLAQIRATRQREARRKKITWAGVGALGLGGVVAWLLFDTGTDSTKKPAKHAKARPVAAVPNDENVAAAAQPGVAEPVNRSPTQGKPIRLLLVPAGARVVINLRPAELWQAGGPGEEFRACLGPLGVWLEQVLKTECLLEPARIEEALVCLIAPSRGVPPDISLVVHTKDDIKKSEMIDHFNGQIRDDLGRPCYIGPEKAYMILDQRTFAITSNKMAQDMVQAADTPGVTVDFIEEMLQHTDRDRHFTIVFEPQSIRFSAPYVAPEPVQPLLNALMDWVGDDVEAVAWSMHLGEKFYSELLFRNMSLTSPPRLQRALQKKLESTPADVLALVRQMNPPELGRKKIVGRFPAMTKAYALATHVSKGNRLVTLETDLPERAAPNLALGTLLAWDQTTRPDFGQKAPAPPSGGKEKKLPETYAERLRMKIDVDFRRAPLQDAIAFVAEEIGANFKIEGNDLKMVGVTQNVVQTFKLDQAPATAVLYEILEHNKKDKLVIVVDEKKKLITVTSEKAAQEKNLKPFPLSEK